MMKILLLILMCAHGLLHLLGFVKAFKLAPLTQMPHPITKVNGILWLIAACLIISCGVMFYTNMEGWWIVGVISVVVSEYVIVKDWSDAGLGTTLNILVLIICILGFGFWRVSGVI